MQHYEFENWGKYNSLCHCPNCRKKFKYRMWNRWKRTEKKVLRSAILFEKAYFSKPHIKEIVR